MPKEWLKRVEAIFEAMALHYGATRMAAHWNGLDPDRLKAYWAAKLETVSSDSVRYVLNNLPRLVPNIDEFLEIAGRAPRPHQPLLGGIPSTREHALDQIQQLKQKFPRFDTANYPKPEPIKHETSFADDDEPDDGRPHD